MRIIAGSMRGTKLFTHDGLNTRPTLDRVKEPLFSIINFKLQDSIVLDLFSGSGALGLESVSRGAKRAYLCDKSKDAIRIIKQNVEKTRAEEKTEIILNDYKKALEQFSTNNTKFDIIFLDPPYETSFAEEAIEIVVKNNLLNDNGIIIIETDTKERVIKNISNMNVRIYDERKYGRVSLIFLCTEERNV